MVGSVQYQLSSMVGSVQYQLSSMLGSSFYISISPVPARLAWCQVFISVSVQYQLSSMVGQVFISVSVQYQLSSMLGSSFYISVSPVPAVWHGGVKFLFLYQCQSYISTSTSLACQVFIWGTKSSFYISVSPVPVVLHAGAKFLYQCQSSTSRLACWGQVFISVSVQYQSSSMLGSSFYISVSPVPAV